jgi:acyl phosphate:glycerol-3-phosphate acyltransferase
LLADILAAIFGYLLGSIPFGLLLTKAAGAGDVRSIGSGNIGATNVLRTGRKGLAAATLLLDGLKGTAAVLLAPTALSLLGQQSPLAALIAGLGAFAGHLFPVWLGFKGGKGVATYIGVAFGLNWRIGLAFVLAWLATAAATRISSLSALVAMIAVPIVAYFVAGPTIALGCLGMTAMAFYMHSQNISRLLAGTEPKIGAKG